MTIGMDWFLLDLLLMALIYVPLERLWPQYPEQGTFRKGVDPGRGLFHVHSSADPDFVFSRFAARHPGHQIFGCSRSPATYCSNAPGFCSFFLAVVGRGRWRIFLFIWLCTKCRFYGDFTPFTILRRRSIGSRAHAPTLWTTHLSADLSLFR